jgi:peptide/nickel transport system permease protein
MNILRRIAWMLFVVWATSTAAFTLSQIVPSDPARMAAGPQARPQDVARVRKELGLDGSSATRRYLRFMRRLVHTSSGARPEEHKTCETLGPIHVDLGKSYQQRRGVALILEEALPRTLLLAVAALFVEIALGVALGLWCGTRAGSASDRVVGHAGLVLTSAPTFLVGLLFQYVFAHRLGVLPLDGYGDTSADHARALVLPALTLGVAGSTYYARFVRDEVARALESDFVRTARAKGASRARVVIAHALRCALLPVVTLAGLDFGALLGGAVVTETLFRWPGMGALSATALLDRDGPLMMGCVLCSALAVSIASAVVDVSYPYLDPRTRRAR